ncbi:hypothetical protein [Herbaspirillum sp. SJZ107]|uniref:hypothetical protein n=1 Tax=Herbaspirillum sp. SJZ107 TaxID=2572881 RepID=UPI00114EBC1A|nr:hypothetical protein [Herbaspirillum sp. SJZ107]
MKQKLTPVAGTTRKRLTFDDGSVLDRQFVYLHPHTWNKLRKLSITQGVSGSRVIENLIHQKATPDRETLAELQKQREQDRNRNNV